MADNTDREEKLKAVLFREEQESRNWQDAAMTDHRQRSLDYYERNKRAFPAEDGQSSVITSEYLDTVESIMPALMRVFSSGENVVQFTPDNPGDEQAAKEASDYIPHLFMRENEGFTWLYWFLKDALMYRLAWGAVDIEEVEQVKSKSFKNVPEDQFALMSQEAMRLGEEKGAQVDIDAEQDPPDDTGKQPKAAVQYSKGHLDSHCGICSNFQGGACRVTASAGSPTPGTIDPTYWCTQFAMLQPGQVPQPPAPTTFTGKITTTRKVKKVVIDNIAPEDGLVSPMARHVDQASFVGYRKQVTASDLRVLGLSQDEIDDLSTDDLYTVEQAQRQPDVIQATSERDTRDDSERTLWVVVAFVRFDWDDDGISEMRRVVYAHAGGAVSAIIENEEWTDGVAPVIPGSPILMSHTIPGLSMFDLVKDIQEVGTAVTRSMLDNTYMVSRPRPAVSDAVDLASLIDWTPGMPVRMRQGQKPTPDNITWLQVPPVMDKTLAVLQYKDAIQQKRTGVTPNNQGLPDDAMNPTATGAALITSAADSRIELIARTLGETSIKRLFRLIYRAVKRVSTDAISYWDGESFATVDPTQWPDDMSLKVDIGLGTSNKQQQLGYLQMVGAGQQQLWAAQGNAEGPVLKLEHLANTFRKAVETAGFSNTNQFVANDTEIEQGKEQAKQNPPPVPPEIQLKQQELQLKQQEAQQAATSSANQDQLDSGRLQFDQQKMATDTQLRQQEMAQKAQELQLRRQEIEAKTTQHAMQLAHDASENDKQRQHDMANAHATRAHDMSKVQAGEDTKRHGAEVKALGSGPRLNQFATTLGDAIKQQGADLRAGFEKLADAMGQETEITTSRGTTARARRVPRK